MNNLISRLGHGKDSFFGVIMRFVGAECEDPRDKIFGLAGLFERQLLRIDYSATVNNIFAEAGVLAIILDRPRESLRLGFTLRALHQELRRLEDLSYSALANDLDKSERLVDQGRSEEATLVLMPYVSQAGADHLNSMKSETRIRQRLGVSIAQQTTLTKSVREIERKR
jgi:hypothetical protein